MGGRGTRVGVGPAAVTRVLDDDHGALAEERGRRVKAVPAREEEGEEG